MKPGPQARARELTQLRARLAVRERQVQLAAQGLKAILAFEPATQSVFRTEVEELQTEAFHALARMEEAQLPHGKSLRARTLIDGAIRKKMIVLAKVRLNTLYGPFAKQPPPDEGLNDE